MDQRSAAITPNPGSWQTYIFRAVILYTCPAQKHGTSTPVIKHPCDMAAKLSTKHEIVAWAKHHPSA